MKCIYVWCLVVIMLSCENRKNYKDIKDCLGQEINVEMIDSIRYKDNLVEFKKIKEDYSHIYIVYLKMGCISCYKKFYYWQNKMNSIHNNKSTVLFVIKGNSYSEFIKQVKIEGLKEDNYYSFLDPNDTYKKGNSRIPLSIIEEPILIDEKDKIELIGNPFSIKEMNRLFLSLIKE